MNCCESGGRSHEAMITSRGAKASSPRENLSKNRSVQRVIKRVFTFRKECDSTEKFQVNDAIRTTRYYGMQNTFEELYKISREEGIVKDLYSLIRSPRNIKLAYKRIKANSGSKTSGGDKQTIQHFKEMSETEFVSYIQKKLENYQSSANGKERPLGIPTMEDRICQQAVRQVIEPICEAKFNKHSHGFRPLEGCESALADVYQRINISHYYWAISLDIKGFFDNVNHRRLRQALWGIGIRDTRVLQIIMKMVKADIREPNGQIVQAEKGTPQGGFPTPSECIFKLSRPMDEPSMGVL